MECSSRPPRLSGETAGSISIINASPASKRELEILAVRLDNWELAPLSVLLTPPAGRLLGTNLLGSTQAFICSPLKIPSDSDFIYLSFYMTSPY